jgi:hypothetical protein
MLKDWLARVALTTVLNWLKKQFDEWLEARARAELRRRADAQIVREHTPSDDDDLDKRLHDGSA